MGSRANELDGLSGIFWLFMNRGQYFATPQKVFLTMLNVGLIVIATALVCAVHVHRLITDTDDVFSAR